MKDDLSGENMHISFDFCFGNGATDISPFKIKIPTGQAGHSHATPDTDEVSRLRDYLTDRF